MTGHDESASPLPERHQRAVRSYVVRTGRMRYWPDGSKVLGNPPGLSLEAARWLTGQHIIVNGGAGC